MRKDPAIVYRGETFNAGNDYLGPETARDINFIEDCYGSAIYAWVLHLKTGRIGIYVDYPFPEGTETLLEQIDSLELHCYDLDEE